MEHAKDLETSLNERTAADLRIEYLRYVWWCSKKLIIRDRDPSQPLELEMHADSWLISDAASAMADLAKAVSLPSFLTEL